MKCQALFYIWKNNKIKFRMTSATKLCRALRVNFQTYSLSGLHFPSNRSFSKNISETLCPTWRRHRACSLRVKLGFVYSQRVKLDFIRNQRVKHGLVRSPQNIRTYCIYPRYSDRQAWANRVDQDASHPAAIRKSSDSSIDWFILLHIIDKDLRRQYTPKDFPPFVPVCFPAY